MIVTLILQSASNYTCHKLLPPSVRRPFAKGNMLKGPPCGLQFLGTQKPVSDGAQQHCWVAPVNGGIEPEFRRDLSVAAAGTDTHAQRTAPKTVIMWIPVRTRPHGNW
jgi:hypothetical protein